MLDGNILEQLKGLYSVLENKVTLELYQSDSEKWGELKKMLEEVSSLSDKIELKELKEKYKAPKFRISYKGIPNGISMVGIPGGHEFTSFVLSILNSDGKGSLPDSGIIRRIKNLKGNISLRTFISLSCENCPEVVQALNVMAIFNENFSHEMVDGSFFPEEGERLKIQAVPSIIFEDKLLSSGKDNLAGLLEKLEEKFGMEKSEREDLGLFDVAVIGGGPAGVSASIYTARKAMKTILVTDRMGGQVQDTVGIENFISIPYIEGPQLANHLKEHVEKYNIEFLNNRRVGEIRKKEDLFEVHLNSPEIFHAKKVIIATGAKWRELNIEGEREYRGRGVAYCPHCDGPYYKGKDVAVIGGGNSGVEAAIDLSAIVKSVTLIEFAEELRADQVLVEKLKSLSNTSIIKNSMTKKILGDGDKVVGMEIQNRKDSQTRELSFDGVFVQIGLIPNSEFIKDLVERNSLGEIIVDERCQSSKQGIYAAGDVTNIPYKQIIISMGEGAKAGLSAFTDFSMGEDVAVQK